MGSAIRCVDEQLDPFHIIRGIAFQLGQQILYRFFTVVAVDRDFQGIDSDANWEFIQQ